MPLRVTKELCDRCAPIVGFLLAADLIGEASNGAPAICPLCGGKNRVRKLVFSLWNNRAADGPIPGNAFPPGRSLRAASTPL